QKSEDPAKTLQSNQSQVYQTDAFLHIPPVYGICSGLLPLCQAAAEILPDNRSFPAAGHCSTWRLPAPKSLWRLFHSSLLLFAVLPFSRTPAPGNNKCDFPALPAVFL